MKFTLISESISPNSNYIEKFSYNDLLSNMIGNVSETDLDNTIKFFNGVARLLRTKADRIISFRSDDFLYSSDTLVSENKIISNYEVSILRDFQTNEVVCIEQYLFGNYWYYVKDEKLFYNLFSVVSNEKLRMPAKNETESDYMNSFMRDQKSINEFPNYKQRYAVGKSYYDKFNESFDGIKINAKLRAQLNAVVRKYTNKDNKQFQPPEVIRQMNDELYDKFGVEYLITGYPDSIADDGGESWTVDYTLNGVPVENSKLVYSVYKNRNSNINQAEYTIYFS